MFIWQGRVQIMKATRRQRAIWQPLMSGRFRAGQLNKGKGLWCLMGAGDAYSHGPIWDTMGSRGEKCIPLVGGAMA